MKQRKTFMLFGLGLQLPMWRLMVLMVLVSLLFGAVPVKAKNLKVKVVKACEDCRLPAAPGRCQSSKKHWDKALLRSIR
jgi:hypothetical protein